MKVKVSESNLGIEYIADVISSCEQNGVECIVDDKNGDIYYYDPKRHKYGDDRLLHNNDTSIWDIVKDKKLFDAIMFDASGAIFKDFAVKWNDLQKKEDGDDVFKTKHCNSIRGNFSEKARNTRPATAKDREEFEKFRAKWKALGDKPSGLGGSKDGLSDDAKAHLERLKHTKDDFGMRVNGIEAQVSESEESDDWSASEGEVEIMWTVDYPEFGIESGDTESFVVEYDDVAPDNEYDIEDNGLKDEICRLIGKEYPDLDFDPDDFTIVNEREFWGQREQNMVYPYDESNEDVVEGIPNWATTYIMYGDVPGDMTEEDVELVDAYLEKLANRGIQLIAPIEGTENEFNPCPAFGKACSTSTWIANEI